MDERIITTVTCDNAVWTEGLDGAMVLVTRTERGERLLAEMKTSLASPYAGRHRAQP